MSLSHWTATLLATGGVAAPAAAAEVPAITNPAVVTNTPRKVVFSAVVDPGGEPTTARLEFGETAALGAQSGAIELSGDEPISIRVTVNTQQNATYHWRFRATNASGTTTTEIRTVTAQKKQRPRVVPEPRIAFAVDTRTSGSVIGRLVGFTRPRGVPAGTRVTVRCVSRCRGGRTVTAGAKPSGGSILRFHPAIAVTRRSVLEIRAVLSGSLGRVRRYVFRPSGVLLEPHRVASFCLTDARPPRRTPCSG